jgi:predicted secreted protein
MSAKGFGTYIQKSNEATPPVYTNIAEVTSIGGPNLARDTVDTTNMDSTDGWKTYLASLKDGGDITVDVNYIPDNTTHQAALTQLGTVTEADTLTDWRVAFGDYGTGTQVAVVDPDTDLLTDEAHGLTTGTAVMLSTSGTLPTSVPQVTNHTIYFVNRAGADTFSLHASNADAVAGANTINFSTAGTGDLSVLTGSAWTFSAGITAFSPTASVDSKLSGTLTLKVSGAPSFPA